MISLKRMMMFEQIEKVITSQSVPVQKGVPASSDLIAQVEQKHHLAFGPKYKQFLSKFGFLSIGPIEIYGLCGDNNSIPSAIHATLCARDRSDNFPSSMVLFYEVGDGSFYAVDSSDNVHLFEYDSSSATGMQFDLFLETILAKLRGGVD